MKPAQAITHFFGVVTQTGSFVSEGRYQQIWKVRLPDLQVVELIAWILPQSIFTSNDLVLRNWK